MILTLDSLASLFSIGFGAGIAGFGFLCGLVAVPAGLTVAVLAAGWLVLRKRPRGF